MSSPFASAIAQAMVTIGDVAGEPVEYWRGSHWVTATAVPGSTSFELQDTDGATVGFTSSDFIFRSADLVVAGQVITPRRGDLIKRSIGGVNRVFEVLSDGSQVYRYCDRERSRIRVHTKEKPAN